MSNRTLDRQLAREDYTNEVACVECGFHRSGKHHPKVRCSKTGRCGECGGQWPCKEHGPMSALTKKEMRQQFVDTALALVNEWSKPLGPEFAKSIAEAGGEIPYRLEGLLHSLFSVFDGCVGDLPGFDLVPVPHPDDKAYRREQGEDWWVSKPINDDCQLKDLVSEIWRHRSKERGG